MTRANPFRAALLMGRARRQIPLANSVASAAAGGEKAAPSRFLMARPAPPCP